MHRASCPPRSQLFRALRLFAVTVFIAAGCGNEGGRPFGDLKITTGPDGGQMPANSGAGGEARGVVGTGGSAVSMGTGGAAGAKGVGGASVGTGTGGLVGLGSGGATVVSGTGGARPAGSGGMPSGSGGVRGAGGVAATSGTGSGPAPHGSGGTAGGAGGVKGTGGALASSGGAVGSGGRPASSGGSPGSGGNVPPVSTGGTTPPPGSGGVTPPPGSGGAGGAGTAGKNGGGTGGSPVTEDCDQLIKDYDAAMTDAKACKAGDTKGECKESVPAKLAGCGSECTTFVQKKADLEAIQKRWDKAGCSAAACLISLCGLTPTSGTCDPSGTCTDSVLGL